MRLGWGRDDGPFFFSCPGRKPHERCEPGPILLCMGLFSRFCVWAPRCTAEEALRCGKVGTGFPSRQTRNAFARRSCSNKKIGRELDARGATPRDLALRIRERCGSVVAMRRYRRSLVLQLLAVALTALTLDCLAPPA